MSQAQRVKATTALHEDTLQDQQEQRSPTRKRPPPPPKDDTSTLDAPTTLEVVEQHPFCTTVRHLAAEQWQHDLDEWPHQRFLGSLPRLAEEGTYLGLLKPGASKGPCPSALTSPEGKLIVADRWCDSRAPTKNKLSSLVCTRCASNFRVILHNIMYLVLPILVVAFSALSAWITTSSSKGLDNTAMRRAWWNPAKLI